MGYKGILCEGLDRILKGRTSNQTYAAPDAGEFSVLLRNVRLSDDIAFRFDDPTWNEQPLTAEKYAGWIHSLGSDTCNVNLFFDYETFGIHKKADTGIFGFLEYLPSEILKNEAWKFLTPAEVADTCYPKDLYNVPQTISWEDQGKLCCVWCENMMQNNTLRKIYSLESIVKQCQIPGALECWGRLQSADHFYFMCNDGRQANDTYRMLNPFENPEAAYENYRNAVMDFEIRLIQNGLAVRKVNQKTGSVPKIYSSIF
jgi:alpha-amylase